MLKEHYNGFRQTTTIGICCCHPYITTLDSAFWRRFKNCREVSVKRLPGNTGQARLTTTWIKSTRMNSSDYNVLEQIQEGGVFEVYRDDEKAKSNPNINPQPINLINDNPDMTDNDEHK